MWDQISEWVILTQSHFCAGQFGAGHFGAATLAHGKRVVLARKKKYLI